MFIIKYLLRIFEKRKKIVFFSVFNIFKNKNFLKIKLNLLWNIYCFEIELFFSIFYCTYCLKQFLDFRTDIEESLCIIFLQPWVLEFDLRFYQFNQCITINIFIEQFMKSKLEILRSFLDYYKVRLTHLAW